MDDVHIAFGIITHCFVQQLWFHLWCTPPSFIFIEFFTSFDSSFFLIFGCLLGPRSFDNLEGPLTCIQAYFSMTFNGIKFIPMDTIAPTTYLRNSALVALIISTRFIID
jgi:hypothetical protein